LNLLTRRYSVTAQFGVVLVGFVAGFAGIAFDVAKKLATDKDYRSRTAMKASFAYYGGEFGERLAQATASLLALLDVQQTTMAFNAFISLRCDGYKGYDDTFLREEPDTV